MEQFTFFYGHTREHGEFSNFYPSVFKDTDGTRYISNEQYIMAGKARLFKDEETLAEIMKARNPSVIKRLGRQVKNFNYVEWMKHAKEIGKRGARLKFIQNEELRKALLKTEGTTLVEAAPNDRRWGIGRSVSDPLARNRSTWRGRNILGELLTELREEIN